MAIKFGNYSFEGPFPSTKMLYDKPAVYAIMCKDIREESRFYLIDIGESDKPKTEIELSDKKITWVKKCQGTGTLCTAIYYAEKMTKQERLKVVNEIRKIFENMESGGA